MFSRSSSSPRARWRLPPPEVRVLLDECVPEILRTKFVRHDVETVRFRGWKGETNGRLIALALEAGFHAIVTADRFLYPDHKVSAAGLRVIVLTTNRLRLLAEAVPAIEELIDTTPVGTTAVLDPLPGGG